MEDFESQIEYTPVAEPFDGEAFVYSMLSHIGDLFSGAGKVVKNGYRLIVQLPTNEGLVEITEEEYHSTTPAEQSGHYKINIEEVEETDVEQKNTKIRNIGIVAGAALVAGVVIAKKVHDRKKDQE